MHIIGLVVIPQRSPVVEYFVISAELSWCFHSVH